MPTATDLVTDLPADFEVFGQAVDTRLKALQPGTTLGDIAYSSATANTSTRLPIGTTGQVLSVVAGVPAWTTGTTGDIEGVTAGVGISGGGTSGTVTVTNSMATALTTKGDIIAATGSGTFSRQGVGTDGQVLTADSTQADGLIWATPASGGMTVLATGTFSGAATTTISSINQTYNDLRLVVRDLNPQTAAQNFRVQFNGVSSGYIMNSTGTNSNASISATFVSGVGCDAGATDSIIVMDACDYAFTGSWKTGRILGFMVTNTSNTNFQNWAWGFNSTSAISSIAMSMTSGNINGGTYILYGVK